MIPMRYDDMDARLKKMVLDVWNYEITSPSFAPRSDDNAAGKSENNEISLIAIDNIHIQP